MPYNARIRLSVKREIIPSADLVSLNTRSDTIENPLLSKVSNPSWFRFSPSAYFWIVQGNRQQIGWSFFLSHALPFPAHVVNK